MSAFLLFLAAAAATTPTTQDKVKEAQTLADFDKPVPPGKVSVANPRSIVALLQKEGYRAKFIAEPGKRPRIESAANGANFDIYLQNCKDNRDCQDVMFSASYNKRKEDPVTIEKMNEYNRDNRWARGYIDKDGDPVIEYDVLFTNQVVDEKAFSEAVAIWSDVQAAFHKIIGF